MSTPHNSNPLLYQFDRCFQMAAEQASVAMSRWTGGQVDLAIDEVREMPLENVTRTFCMEDQPLTMVVVGVGDDSASQLFLAFDEQHGRRLMASLVGRQVDESAPWSKLEKSAAMETGNIFSSAYLNELSRLAGECLVPAPPYFVHDFGGSVLEQTLCAHAMTSDQILVCHTRFEFNREATNWSMLFLPSPKLCAAIERAVGAMA